MPVNRRKRQILLFLVAILIPAAVLIGLAGRLVYQDQELAARREDVPGHFLLALVGGDHSIERIAGSGAMDMTRFRG